jgi:hypothetical protein
MKDRLDELEPGDDLLQIAGHPGQIVGGRPRVADAVGGPLAGVAGRLGRLLASRLTWLSRTEATPLPNSATVPRTATTSRIFVLTDRLASQPAITSRTSVANRLS